jgi:signal transduction histidine kinase/CheY-like chemotaxis protein
VTSSSTVRRGPIAASDWAALAFIAIYLVALTLGLDGSGTVREILIPTFFVIGGLTIVAQLRIARSSAFDARTREAWRWLAASSAFIVVNGIIWTVWLDAHPGETTPEWSNLLAQTYTIPAIIGFWRMPRDTRIRMDDPRVLLDAALLAVAGLAVSWHFSLRPLLTDTAVRPIVADYVSILAEWLVFVAASVALLRARGRVLRTAVSIAIVAQVGSILADFFWSRIAADYRAGGFDDTPWFVAWVLRWCAAQYAWYAVSKSDAGAERSVSYRSGVAPTAFLAGAYLLLVYLVFTGGGNDAVQIALLTNLMTVLLVARQRVELRENHRLMRARLAQGERFRALLRHATDYIAVLDDAFRITWASPSVGRGDPGIVGTSFAELAASADRAALVEWLSTPRPRATALPFPCRMRGSEDAWVEVELRCDDRRHDPTVRGIVVDGRDVSSERALEGRLRHAKKLITLHDVAGRMAHAFNNLLATIAGHAELLSHELHDIPGVGDDLAAIRAAADRGGGISRQLLGFSGTNVIQPVRLPLAETLEALVPSLDRSLPVAVRLELEVNDRSVHALFDRGQFEQVLVNLVANARDAMPAGGTIRVSLGASRSADGAGTAVIEVRDSGTGIRPEDLAHIFKPFFTTKAPGAGTGLGLAMVDTIVRRAGGTADVESAVGGGTSIVLRLPLVESETASTASRAVEPEPVNAHGIILLVDDEPGVRNVSRRMLERAGFTVVEASNGADAIAHAESGRIIDLLITDMMMPGVSGREVIARFTTLRPRTPIIVVTGFAEQDDDRSLETSVSAIVAKPFTSAVLLRAVRSALGIDTS